MASPSETTLSSNVLVRVTNGEFRCCVCENDELFSDWRKHVSDLEHEATLKQFDTTFERRGNCVRCRSCLDYVSRVGARIHAKSHLVAPWFKPSDEYQRFFENSVVQFKKQFHCCLCDVTFDHWFLALNHLKEKSHRTLRERPSVGSSATSPAGHTYESLVLEGFVPRGFFMVDCKFCKVDGILHTKIKDHIDNSFHHCWKLLFVPRCRKTAEAMDSVSKDVAKNPADEESELKNQSSELRFFEKFSEGFFECSVCDRLVGASDERTKSHLAEVAHAVALKKYGCNDITLKPGDIFHCGSCDVSIPDHKCLRAHIKQESHATSMLRKAKKPEAGVASISETVSKPISETVSKPISETVPKPTSETISKPIPETISETISRNLRIWIGKRDSTISYCRVCNTELLDSAAVDLHLADVGHLATLKKHGCEFISPLWGNDFRCSCCDCRIPGHHNLYLHAKGRRHNFSLIRVRRERREEADRKRTEEAKSERPEWSRVVSAMANKIMTLSEQLRGAGRPLGNRMFRPIDVGEITCNICDAVVPGRLELHCHLAGHFSGDFDAPRVDVNANNWRNVFAAEKNRGGQKKVGESVKTKFGIIEEKRRNERVNVLSADARINETNMNHLPSDVRINDETEMNHLLSDVRTNETRMNRLPGDARINETKMNHLPSDVRINETKMNRFQSETRSNETKMNHLPSDARINGTKVNHLSSDVRSNETRMNHLPSDARINGTKINHLPSDVRSNETKINHLPSNGGSNGTKMNHLPSDAKSNDGKQNELSDPFTMAPSDSGSDDDEEKEKSQPRLRQSSLRSLAKTLNSPRDNIYDMRDKLRDVELGTKFCVVVDPEKIYCLVCRRVVVNTLQNYFEHLRGLDHVEYLERMTQDHRLFERAIGQFSELDLADQYLEETEDPKMLRCLVCDETVVDEDSTVRDHIEEANHEFVRLELHGAAERNFQDTKSRLHCDWYNVHKYWCVPCSVDFATEANFTHHLESRKHAIAKLQKENVDRELIYDFCAPCGLLLYGYRCSYAYHCDVTSHKWLVRDGHYVAPDLPDAAKDLLAAPERYVEDAIASLAKVATVEREREEALTRDLVKAVRSKFFRAKAHVFGSRASGLGSSDSDVDVFLDCDNRYEGKGRLQVSVKQLMKDVRKCLSDDSRAWDVNELLTNSRSPIVRASHRATGLACDITVENGLSVENTELVKSFNDVFPACRKLTVFLKRWLACCNLLGSDRISSYALCWYVIFYLQRESILPSVAKLIAMNKKSRIIADWEVGVSPEFTYNEAAGNYSLKEFLVRFFTFYANFDFRHDVACPLLGEVIEKRAFANPRSLPKEMAPYVAHVGMSEDREPLRIDSPMCIQDPFDLQHNITKAVSKVFLSRFRTCCSKSLDLLCLP